MNASRLKRAYRRLKHLPTRWRNWSHGIEHYPRHVAADGPNTVTVETFKASGSQVYAEIGVYRGATAKEIARHLNGTGHIHLFDYQERVDQVAQDLRASGFANVTAHGNSHKLFDSYNWSLLRLIQKHRSAIFDYVFLDGAHTFPVDALTFFLVDRLLKVGGLIDFDDYDWTLAKSSSLKPEVFPLTAKLYTPQQMREPHVALLVEELVKTDARYIEVVPRKVYRKAS